MSLGQLKVMSAIERCRTAALGGHVAACEKCGHSHIAYNSCRNRHCPKCQGAAAKDWLAARQAELLPVEYYHVVFTLPAPIADIAYQNKAAVYGILFKAAAETLIAIAVSHLATLPIPRPRCHPPWPADFDTIKLASVRSRPLAWRLGGSRQGGPPEPGNGRWCLVRSGNPKWVWRAHLLQRGIDGRIEC